MRVGVAASAIAHIGIILIVLFGLNNAHALTPPAVESIAVDLIPVQDTASVRQGSLNSKVIDTKAPAIVESNKPATLAKPTGNTAQDQAKPAQADTPTPMPTTNSAPAPAPAPAPTPDPVVPAPAPAPVPEPNPEPDPTPAPAPAPAPAPEPKPAPTPDASAPDAQLAADSSQSADSAPPVPAPAVHTASIDEKRAELKKQQDAAAKAAADAAKAASDAKAAADAQKAADAAKAKAAADAAKAAAAAQAVADAKAAQAKKAADAKKLALAQQAQAAAQAADEISSIINKDNSKGAKTGDGGTPTAGKPTGTAARLSQSEIGALIGQIKKCWTLLPNEIESGLSVRLMVNLNRDGSVNGVPQIVDGNSTPMGGSVSRAAQRAIMECGPYNLAAEKYQEWSQLDVTLMTSDQ